ncbi:MAG: hypothetical protein E7165_01505 [Firmicutes bacterium]|nr:hypothetical protein [Bacillota bacterium]
MAYKIYFFYLESRIIMKEIGEKLKDAREAMGVSLNEAAEDLKLETSQIENLEQGNMENFKDIYYLKYLIRDYSKYLGLDKEDLVNEFNEYLFDYTSKISLEDIKKAKEFAKPEEDKIKSPYTIEYKGKTPVFTVVAYCAIALILVLILVFVIFEFTKNENKDTESIVMNYVTK